LAKKKATARIKAKSAESIKPGAEAPAKEEKGEMDFAQVRENISKLVGESASAIARQVIESAKAGQLASARYLFEVAGLYPTTELPEDEGEKDSLAQTLLRRMGLPLEPVNSDDSALRGTEGPGKVTRMAPLKKASEEAEDGVPGQS
jgi:hypothetical protein